MNDHKPTHSRQATKALNHIKHREVMKNLMIALIALFIMASCAPTHWYKRSDFFPRRDYYIKEMQHGDSVIIVTYHKDTVKIEKYLIVYGPNQKHQ